MTDRDANGNRAIFQPPSKYQPPRRRTFRSPYSVDVPLSDGTPVRVVRAIRHPDADHDREALPMYELETDDGRTVEAYREEIHP